MIPIIAVIGAREPKVPVIVVRTFFKYGIDLDCFMPFSKVLLVKPSGKSGKFPHGSDTSRLRIHSGIR